MTNEPTTSTTIGLPSLVDPPRRNRHIFGCPSESREGCQYRKFGGHSAGYPGAPARFQHPSGRDLGLDFCNRRFLSSQSRSFAHLGSAVWIVSTPASVTHGGMVSIPSILGTQHIDSHVAFNEFLSPAANSGRNPTPDKWASQSRYFAE